MFCGKCGAENHGENQFCYSCGAPLVVPSVVPLAVSPKRKSKKALVITLISLFILMLAVATVLIFVVFKPSDTASPEDIAIKYFKALQKGDEEKIKACFLPEAYDMLEDSITNKTRLVTDFVKENKSKIEYEIYDFNEHTGSSFKTVKEVLVNDMGVDANKIEKVGVLDANITIDGSSRDVKFSLIKYNKKWYILVDPLTNMAIMADPSFDD